MGCDLVWLLETLQKRERREHIGHDLQKRTHVIRSYNKYIHMICNRAIAARSQIKSG